MPLPCRVSHSLFLPAWVLSLALFAFGAGCGGSSSETGNAVDGGGSCSVGAVNCPCTNGGACDPGLVCGDSNVCEEPVECACNVDETCVRSCACDTDCTEPPENCLVKHYDAYSQAEGPNCGNDGSATAECLPGDICIDEKAGTCQVVHSGLDDISCPGRPYDAYSRAGGPNCGNDGSATAECKPADRCADEVTGECEVIGSAGGAIACGMQTYEAFSQAGGPNCGNDGSATAECYGGDVCEDEVTGRCRFVHSPVGDVCPDQPYDAYSQAGGPNCGNDGSATAECKPADRCADEVTGECEIIGSSGGAMACGTQTYEAFSQAGGPNCGNDGSATAECYGGDVCEDEVTGRCRFVHSPTGSNCPDVPYDAYSQAGGPNCGNDGSATAECKPGDSCVDETLGTCN